MCSMFCKVKKAKIIFEWVGEGTLLQVFEVRSILVYQNFSQYEVSITVSTFHPGNQVEKCDRKLLFYVTESNTLDKSENL